MSGFSNSTDFVQYARQAPCISKPEFIQRFVAGKDVLDLGVVAHSLEFMKKYPDQWLHGFICRHARSSVGVDTLEDAINELRKLNYDVICGNALTLQLGRQFDVVVCGDLIEHVSNPAALLHSIYLHLRNDGVALITTPNPFSVNRLLNIVFDGSTPINMEHTCWFCPQTIFQSIERSELSITDFYWVSTNFPMCTKKRYWGRLANWIGSLLEKRNNLLRTDYGIVLKKRQAKKV